MPMTRKSDVSARCRSGGFSLVELMVALVVGLIIIGAVLALVVSIMRSNRQTLEVTRLTQELRATMSVVSADLRRARGIEDPLSAKDASGLLVNPYAAIDVNLTGDCIRFAYDGGSGAGVWRVIRHDNNGDIVLATGGAAVDCTTAGTKLNSDQVAIESLQFNSFGAASPGELKRIGIRISGRLANTADPNLTPVRRVIDETIYVRSVGDG